MLRNEYYDFTERIEDGVSIVLFMSLLVRDILAIDDFLKTKVKFEEESSLKDKLGTMCFRYDVNDRKIYERAVFMKINDNLDRQIKNFLDKTKKIQDLDLDTNYFKTDVRKHIKRVKYELLSKNFSRIRVIYMRIVEWMYENF